MYEQSVLKIESQIRDCATSAYLAAMENIPGDPCLRRNDVAELRLCANKILMLCDLLESEHTTSGGTMWPGE